MGDKKVEEGNGGTPPPPFRKFLDPPLTMVQMVKLLE